MKATHWKILKFASKIQRKREQLSRKTKQNFFMDSMKVLDGEEISWKNCKRAVSGWIRLLVFLRCNERLCILQRFFYHRIKYYLCKSFLVSVLWLVTILEWPQQVCHVIVHLPGVNLLFPIVEQDLNMMQSEVYQKLQAYLYFKKGYISQKFGFSFVLVVGDPFNWNKYLLGSTRYIWWFWNNQNSYWILSDRNSRVRCWRKDCDTVNYYIWFFHFRL